MKSENMQNKTRNSEPKTTRLTTLNPRLQTLNPRHYCSPGPISFLFPVLGFQFRSPAGLWDNRNCPAISVRPFRIAEKVRLEIDTSIS